MLVNYSSITSLEGYSLETIADLPYGLTTNYDVVNEVYSSNFGSVYSLGTIDIISNLQTLNVLVCVLLFIQLIIMFFVSYYVVMTRFRFGRG